MTSKTARAAGGAPGHRVRMVMMGMVLTLLAAIGVSAWAQPASPSAPATGMDGGHGRHGMHHGGMGGHGMMFVGSPERMGRMIDRMLDGLNASDSQRAQIKQIVAQAGADLKGQAAAARELRLRGMQVFTAPVVDANAAEQIRLHTMQLHDQMSRRVTQAMVAVASALTPEQRAKVGEYLKSRQARMEERTKRAQPEGPRR